MFKARFIHDGDAIDYTPEADVAAGDVVIIGDLVAVARLSILANALGALAVTGVFDFAKATGSSIAKGVNVYWHTGTQIANTTASGGKLIGKSVRAAGNDDTVVRVRMSQ